MLPFGCQPCHAPMFRGRLPVPKHYVNYMQIHSELCMYYGGRLAAAGGAGAGRRLLAAAGAHARRVPRGAERRVQNTATRRPPSRGGADADAMLGYIKGGGSGACRRAHEQTRSGARRDAGVSSAAACAMRRRGRRLRFVGRAARRGRVVLSGGGDCWGYCGTDCIPLLGYWILDCWDTGYWADAHRACAQRRAT